MPGNRNGGCENAYWCRDTVCCRIMDGKKLKWNFCKHQYFCRTSNQYELSADAAKCTLRKDCETE